MLSKLVNPFCIGAVQRTRKLLRCPVDRSQTVQGGLPIPIPHLKANPIDLLTEQFGQDGIGIPDDRRDPGRHLLYWPQTHADVKPIENPDCLQPPSGRSVMRVPTGTAELAPRESRIQKFV